MKRRTADYADIADITSGLLAAVVIPSEVENLSILISVTLVQN